MKLYLLSKSVYLIKNNASEFLNGLTANEMTKPQNAFLNIHGRIIATFDQLRLDEEEVIVVLEPDYVDDVMAHLDRYMKLSGVVADRLDHHVYFDLDGDASVGNGDYAIAQKAGRLILTKNELESNVTDDAFTLFRLKNNIPVHGIDYNDEMLLNVSMTEYVSFTKGCFLGQEPISKVYNRAKPTWKLIVKFENECSDEEQEKMTSKAIDPESGRALGFVFVKNVE